MPAPHTMPILHQTVPAANPAVLPKGVIHPAQDAGLVEAPAAAVLG
jgi:hypothetical protein